MRFLLPLLLMWLVMLPLATVHAFEGNDTIITYGSSDLLDEESFGKLRSLKEISIGEVPAKEITAVLDRLRQMPNLTQVEFYRCDLSTVDEKNAVPPNVSSVTLNGGTISQGTINWLSKFPRGRSLVFGCDAVGLNFELGKFTWITFDNCKVPRSAVLKLVEKMTEVTFKEVTLVDDGKPD